MGQVRLDQPDGGAAALLSEDGDASLLSVTLLKRIASDRPEVLITLATAHAAENGLQGAAGPVGPGRGRRSPCSS